MAYLEVHDLSQRQAAIQFGVSQPQLSRIVKGRFKRDSLCIQKVASGIQFHEHRDFEDLHAELVQAARSASGGSPQALRTIIAVLSLLGDQHAGAR